MTSPLRLFVVAAEPSGDALGAELIAEIRSRNLGVVFGGVGGPRMAQEGVDASVDTRGLQIVGFVDGLRALPLVRRLADETADAAVAVDADVVVLIDSWGFSWRTAKAIRERGGRAKIIKYIGPQVWASRPGRAAQLARRVDHLLCIFPFEVPYYEPHGLACTVVGYPPLARAAKGDGAAFRRRHGLGVDEPLLLMLPGSRPKEVERITPVFEKAVSRLTREHPGVVVAVFLADNVAGAIRERAKNWRFEALLITDEAEKPNLFAAADVALACSGTVTTEVALQETPVVVGYKVDWVTWAIARLGLVTTRYVTLLNVSAGREIAPEFLQTRCRPDLLAQACGRLLADPGARRDQGGAQREALDAMGASLPPPTVTAADAILELMGA